MYKYTGFTATKEYLITIAATGGDNHVYAIELIAGSSDPVVDKTAPTLASSVPANEATNVAVSGNIVLTMSENVTIADASKITLAGGAGSLTTASIAASGAAVTVPYAELANSTAYTLTVAKGALKDAAENENEAFTVAFTTAASLAEPDYVLVRNNGTLNTDDFITGGTFENNKSWKVGDVTYTSGLKFNNASSSLQFNDNGRFVAYNTKTDAAHVDIAVYNTNSSATVVKVAIIRENADGSLTLVQDEEYNLAARTGSSSSNYVYGYWTGSFDLTGRSTMYVYEKSNSGRIRICQMAVYETGSNNNLAAPAIGYSVNLNKGRMFVAAATATTFEGLTYCLPNKYQPNNTASATIKAKGEDYISFTIPAGQARQLQVKASGSYNVSKTKGDESSYVSGNQNFNLTEGTWYINPNGSNVTITSIAFATAPTAYTVTYSKGDGSVKEGKTIPTQAATIEGGKFNVASGENLEKEDYDFAGWKYTPAVGDPVIYNAGQEFTMPAANVEFVAQWSVHETSDDATLSALTVGGKAVEGFAAATEEYNVELPMGTTAIPTVAATANDDNAKEVKVTQATTLPGTATVVVKAEDNTTTKTYTINFTVADSKDLLLVFRTGTAACSDASTASAMLSDNAAVSSYINKITFNNVEGTGDNGKETGGAKGSLDVGKKAGNMLTLSAKPGYALQAMSFYGKIQDETCEYSLDGGDWTTLSSTNTDGDACYTVFSNEEVREFRLRSTGASGVWIRNMELSIITACTPVKLNWTAEPAAEYEVGKAASAIAATANNGGAVAYSTTASGIVNVAANGALTIAGLGSATLKAATAEGDGTAYCTNGGEDIVISKAVNTYYLVKFDAQNETAVNEVKYYAGDAAIATPEQPSYSGFVFQGWFDAASAGNAVAFPLTPESSRTIYAQWVAECTGPTINVHPASANYLTGRTVSALTCEATSGAAGELTYTWYSCDDAERTNPVVLAGAPTPSTAVAGTFYYYCAVTEAGCDIIRNSNVATITIEDKEPVCIIKSIPTSGNDASVDGYYKGSAFFKGSNAKKLSSGYDYVGVQLMAGKSFLATDKVVLNQAADLGDASDITKFYVFTETPASGKSYAAVDNATPQKGDNWFAMPAELVGKSSFYIGRVDAKCNPTLGYLAVYRAMNPELIAIAIDERAGVIDPMDDKHFNVLIPYSADLADLSIVKTVAWNAPHATASAAVISNEGAWVIGDNTYRLMDKDGDYTDYTITLAREAHYEAKIGETGYATLVEAVAAAVDGDVVVLQENVTAGAGVMIAKADAKRITIDFGGYTYTANSPAVGSVGTQNQAFHFEKGCDITLKNGTITSEGNAIIMLVQNYGDLTLEDITLDGTGLEGSHRYVMSNNCGDVVIGNGTTITAKAGDVAFDVCATNYYPDGVTVTVKDGASITGIVEYDVWGTKPADNKAELAIEGGEFNVTWNVEAALAEDAKENLNVSGGQFSEIVPADYCAEGYAPVTTPNAQGKYEVQDVRVVIFDGSTMSDMATSPSGAISWAKVGSTMGAGDKDKTYKDVHYTRALSCGSSSATKHFRIDVEENTNVKIEVIGMSNSSSDTRRAWLTNSTEKGEYAAAIAGLESEGYNPAEFETEWLEEGSYYLHADNTVAIFLIRVTPKAVPAKCEVPTITTQPATKLDFGAGAMTATVVASVEDGGTLKYQWYNAANNEAVAGATEATLSTTTEGTYYVVVTNTLAEHRDNSVKSAEAQLAHRVMNDATLSVLKYGETAIALEADKYEYRVDLAENTTVVPTLSATATMAPYATVEITDATEFVDYEATSTVVVTSEDATANKTYTVKFYVDHIYTALVPVTGSTTWNWENAATEDATINDVPNKGAIIANYLSGADFEKIEGKENEKAFRDQNDGVYQGTHLHFTTTVPGKVKFYFRAPSSGEESVITVINNGKEIRVDSTGNSFKWSREVVVYGDVVIEMENKKEGKTDTRVQQIVFTEDAPDYTRNVTNNIGTLCVDHNVLAGGALGATFYQIASRNETYPDKIDFEEVMPGEELKAGEPYIFRSNTGKIELFFGETEETTPQTVRGMHGVLTDGGSIAITEENKRDILYISQNDLYNCTNLTSLSLVKNRAYIVMSEVPTYAEYHPTSQPNNARRRVTLSMNGTNSATDIDNIFGNDTKAEKVLINGQLFILRGGKMFDATGHLVK
ncbi:MAG: InlB B-repeat-containing protein [Paludibacteraceae bacterium]|nr:InlB B-repeat-containing protein [Paludibacteraceae bacterium]